MDEFNLNCKGITRTEEAFRCVATDHINEDGRQTWEYTVETIPPQEFGEKFRLEVVLMEPKNNWVRVTMMEHDKHSAYSKKGIVDALLPIVQKRLNKNVCSSPKEDRENQHYRFPDATTVWDRLPANYDEEEDIYTLRPLLKFRDVVVNSASNKNYTEIAVDTADEFLTQLMQLSQAPNIYSSMLYRGEGDATRDPIPSAYRKPGEKRLTRIGAMSGSGATIDTTQGHILLEIHALAHFYRVADEQGLPLPPLAQPIHQALTGSPETSDAIQ